MPTQPMAFRAGRVLFQHCTILIALLLAAGVCAAQTPPRATKAQPQTQSPDDSLQQTLSKYPGLLPAFGHFFEKLQRDVRFPEPRAESRILALLPESTIAYAAIPNYGDVARQSLEIFRQELQENPVLRDWWLHGDLATAAPAIEDGFEKFTQLHEFLGNEVVISGEKTPRGFDLLIVAEARKPGIRDFLQQAEAQATGRWKAELRVLDSGELATAKQRSPAENLLLLVRPDYIVLASDISSLRRFNLRLDRRAREFATTSFGQRIQEEYDGGATLVAAADLHRLLAEVPLGTPQNQTTVERTGFSDVKYAVWSHKKVSGQAVSQAELSFTGPRRSIASWLAKPAPLTTLDFVAPTSLFAATLVLTEPTHILEDLQALSAGAPNNPLAALPMFESALQVSFRDDLLAHLSGEITFELDSIARPQPAWKAVLKLKDGAALRQTLNKLLAAGNIAPERVEDAGVAYYIARFPSQGKLNEVTYAFVDNHLVIASSRDGVAEAVQLHRTGGSLAKSSRLLAAVPAGGKLEASALFYQDPLAMTALRLQQAPPEARDLLSKLTNQVAPSVVLVYGDESSIRETSKSAGIDAGVVLVAAAVAIPNLLRSKVAANEASAVGSLRTINTAEVAYSTMYPETGFAPDLATLGPGIGGRALQPAAHASLIDNTLGNAACSGDAWCTKSGYQFRISAACKLKRCTEYVVVAVPLSANSGVRSFCSTSDALIRFQSNPMPPRPVTAEQCRSWQPLN